MDKCNHYWKLICLENEPEYGERRDWETTRIFRYIAKNNYTKKHEQCIYCKENKLSKLGEIEKEIIFSKTTKKDEKQ